MWRMTQNLFGALLKHWRRRRGWSQLDLALGADVSARHVSFLESGRAHPSEEMALRLLSALEVPLRDQNGILLAASFPARFAEPGLDAIHPSIDLAITRMLRQQEPFPLTVMTAGYDIIRANAAAATIFSHFTAEPDRLHGPPNLFDQVFDPRRARPFIRNWAQLGHHMIARLHREALHREGDARLRALLERALAYPDVPRDWRQPDFSRLDEPTFSLVLERGPLTLRFFTTATAFSAPQQVTLEELLIESYFPLDEATELACEKFRAASPTK